MSDIKITIDDIITALIQAKNRKEECFTVNNIGVYRGDGENVVMRLEHGGDLLTLEYTGDTFPEMVLKCRGTMKLADREDIQFWGDVQFVDSFQEIGYTDVMEIPNYLKSLGVFNH
ncbi:hypothetical protein [Paenibacillus campi]|uniref:hypothetical protein n=1 Tax=Paenibacillus campi TaxID=3106031 RepID=UPI002B00237C|nr:hypothetical protein [Paenibacillus sp. SGZ-1014]